MLLVKNSKSGGRNNNGRITTRHIGGGHKQAYRIVDFKRNKDGIPAVVERLEYDPNRSANIALVLYKDGEHRNIPVDSTVHNVEIKPGKGGQIARSAGTYVQIVARDGSYVTLRLQVAFALWRDGCFPDDPPQKTGRGKPSPQKNVC